MLKRKSTKCRDPVPARPNRISGLADFISPVLSFFKKRPYRPRRMLYTLLGSYLAVLLIPVVLLGSLAYLMAVDAIEDEITDKNVALIKSTQNTLDRQISDLRLLALQIGADRKAQSFASVSLPYNKDTRWQALKLMNDLTAYTTGTHFMNSIYLCYRNSRTALNAGCRYDFDFFGSAILTFDDHSTDAFFNELFDSFHYLDFFPVEEVLYQRTRTDMILMAHTISAVAGRNSDAVLLVLIPASSIRAQLTEAAGDGFACILDRTGRVICADDGFDASRSLPAYNQLTGDAGLFTFDNTLVVTYCSSALSDWKYVCGVDRTDIYRKAEMIRTQTLLFSLLAVVLGGLLALFLSRKNYRPIRRLVDTLADARCISSSDDTASLPVASYGVTSGGRHDAVGYELRYIQEAVDTILMRQVHLEAENLETRRQNEAYRSRLDANRPILQTALLQSLLSSGDTESETQNPGLVSPEELRILADNGITFPFDRLAVLLLSVPGSREPITTLAEKVFSDQLAYIFEADYELTAVLVNLPAVSGGIDAADTLATLAHRISDSAPPPAPTVAVSALHEVPRVSLPDGESLGDPSAVSVAYAEALRVLDYRLLTGTQRVLQYDNVHTVSDRSETQYCYTIEDELALMNSVRRGDVQTALHLLERIYDENVRARGVTVTQLRCLFYDLMGTLYKLTPSSNPAGVPTFSLDTLQRARTADELYALIRNAFSDLATQAATRAASPSYRMRRVLDYVDEHYTSNTLSQTSVAERFGITPAYLSRAFKECAGLNMVEYVSRRRIERVKALLLDSHVPNRTGCADSSLEVSAAGDDATTLSEIAQQVGYLSDLTLIRIFKRYEGVTPKQWLASAGESSRRC